MQYWSHDRIELKFGRLSLALLTSSSEKKTFMWEENFHVTVPYIFVFSAGKVGCLGRSFPSKEHESATKAIQFALRQVNAKIMQG